MSKIEKQPVQPVRGKYTTYVDPSDKGKTKRERMNKLFSGNDKASPVFQGTSPDEITKEAARLFAILHPKVVVLNGADPAFGAAVDLTYSGEYSETSSPSDTLLQEDIDAPGGPMNRFVPNLKSPGPGGDGIVRVEGTDLVENPKLLPSEVTGADNLSLIDNPNLAQPKDTSTKTRISNP